MRSLAVFMYHHINWHRGDLVTLTPEDFEHHLRFIRRAKIESIFLDTAVEMLQRKRPWRKPSVVLTFDDGHLDNWVYAFPLLRKYEVKATIFIVTAWVTEGERRGNSDGPPERIPPIPLHREVQREAGRGNGAVALRWSEIQAMEESGWVDIQSHGHFHHDYFEGQENDWRLRGDQREALERDLKISKDQIERKLQKKCRFLSWPWGKFDRQAIDLAKSLGFEAMVSTQKGVNPPGADVTAIKRVVAKSGRRWFPTRFRIYSNRALGEIYRRISGRI